MVSLNYVIKADKFKRTNTATLYRQKNDIFKVIERGFFLYNELINHIKYNYSLKDMVSPNIILPTDLIVDEQNNIKGYRCNYVNGKNLEGLAKDLDTKEKIALSNQLTNHLKEINKYLVVGDINLDNCMYDKDKNGYLIDFDLAFKLNEKPSLISLYNFTDEKNKEIKSSLSTDKLKMVIVISSLLYGINFEDSFTINDKDSAWNKFLQYSNNSYLKDYYLSSLQDLNKKKIVSDYFFLPNEDSYVKLIEEDKKRIRKLVK